MELALGGKAAHSAKWVLKAHLDNLPTMIMGQATTRTFNYSNYGPSVSASLVERVSGYGCKDKAQSGLQTTANHELIRAPLGLEPGSACTSCTLSTPKIHHTQTNLAEKPSSCGAHKSPRATAVSVFWRHTIFTSNPTIDSAVISL